MSEKKQIPSWQVFWRSKSLAERKDIADKSDCSFLHLRNMATNGVQASPKLAMRIDLATGYPKEKLRPDIFGED